MKRLLLAIPLSMLCFAASAGPVDEARSLFQQYSSLEAAFNPAVADLYADDALIKNKRTYPTGQTREVAIPAVQYKALVRSAMPLAKTKGDYSTYSQVSYSDEGRGVRIKATRYAVLKKYESPLALLVAPDASGKWLIREEISESQP
ncbi:hypothetical protein ACN9MZ_27090 [Pseudoduganella sp. S-14]|jgi:hypothetical protein|uniref:hypothetical protein n=1 Tax=Pseudoduganella sp. S-14 TaxID=3404065 RepID=UPI003CEA43CE